MQAAQSFQPLKCLLKFHGTWGLELDNKLQTTKVLIAKFLLK